jgi:acyl-CoA synthetase (NDP forming)/RimJ/RimL family protein N-acetyltransferase
VAQAAPGSKVPWVRGPRPVGTTGRSGMLGTRTCAEVQARGERNAAHRTTGNPMTTPASTGTYALLADGRTVEIRQARPDDAEAVKAMHAALSPDNAYFRFFNLSAQAPGREARRLCRAPDDDHVALLALLSGKLVGVASWEAAERPDRAEIAFAVSDEMHGRGVATLLLEHLVSLGRRRNLIAFEAETLPDNYAMQRVFADAGLPVEKHFKDGVIQLTFPLPPGDSERLDTYLDAVAARASRAEVASLQHLFRPASVAVVGAGRHRGAVGREILHNIVAGGFPGPVFAVNPHGGAMEGVASLKSALELPEAVDVAVLAVPSAEVPEVASECGRRGVRNLVVVTSGLGSRGADLIAICRRFGMRLVGPNCFGIAVPDEHLNATFAARPPAPGIAGLVMQSGGIGIAVLEQFTRLGIGVSSFASVGDKYDVSSNDLLTWWEEDGQTRLAVLYVESFGNPRGFARTARRVGRKMPVLTIIGGRSVAGQRAAASHTAATATPLVTQEALFEQAGIITTLSLGELIDAAALLACQPLPAGRHIAIVSNAGGAGVLAADACGDAGLTSAVLESSTQRRLTRLLPPGAAVSGPVDTTAAVSADVFGECIKVVADDPAVDALVVIEVPTAIADLTSVIAGTRVRKPLAAVLLDQSESVRILSGDTWSHDGADAGRTPAYAYPEGAVRALAHAASYREWRDSQRGKLPELAGLDASGARALIAGFLAATPDGGWLAEADAAQLLASYQIPLITTRSVSTLDDAMAAAAELGGHVVLKAEAVGVVHKTDAGAVRLDLRTPEEVATAYRELSDRFGADLVRVLVQPMLDGGVETLVGVVQEPVFGPLVVFGLGGVATEVLGDHIARLTPLTDADAEEMIGGVRATPLLTGHRGSPAVDTAALADVLLRVSRLADDLPEVAELDLNPVIARPQDVQAVDFRIRVAPATPRDPFLRQLR